MHFETNRYNDVSTMDALELLHELLGVMGTNAIMIAGSEEEQDERDANCCWAAIAICEGMLAQMEPGHVAKGFETVRADVQPATPRDRKIHEAMKGLLDALSGEDE